MDIGVDPRVMDTTPSGHSRGPTGVQRDRVSPMPTKDTVERIRRMRSDAAPILSVYLQVGTAVDETMSIHARLADLLRPIELKSHDLDHNAAASIRRDIERIMSSADRIAGDLGHGVAIFACDELGVFEYLSVNGRIWDVAVAGRSAYVRPLLATLEDQQRSCAVVIDRRHAWLFECSMGRIELRSKLSEESRRLKTYAGWHGLDEHVARRREEEAWHHHYRDTVDAIRDVMDAHGCTMLFLGGHQGAVDEFAPFLPRGMRAQLSGTFTIDPSMMTPAEVREHVERLATARREASQRQLVEELAERSAEGTFAVLELQKVLDGIDAGAVAELVVETGVEVPGMACDVCGHLDISHARCPLCGAKLRPARDLLEDAAREVIDLGGQVRDVPLSVGTNGVGAFLRFPVPQLRVPATGRPEEGRDRT